ncbi:hypothetical protein L0F63_005900 [Massospora cicadina]|nr:hypothetical protein L0F63_005900 [Massospora cicadina]
MDRINLASQAGTTVVNLDVLSSHLHLQWNLPQAVVMVSAMADCKCELQYLDKYQFSPNLLAIAKHLKVKLTLFVLGHKLDNLAYQKYVKAYYDAGHTIASHTFTHPFVTKLSDADLRNEMIKTDDAIFKLIGVRPIFMRNPYSDTDERTMALFQSMGYKSIFTSLDTEDTVYYETNPSRILLNVINGLRANPSNTSYVITQHETLIMSVNYLPAIFLEIKKRGYTIVPIDQCFGINGTYRNNKCGDGVCSGYLENCSTCSKDCGTCPPKSQFD